LVKFTFFLRASDYMQIKFECVCPTPLCSFDLGIYIIQFFSKYIIILSITFHLDIRGVGPDTLEFNLHIIGRTKKRAKKGCEFNQKRCEFKILQILLSLSMKCWNSVRKCWNSIRNAESQHLKCTTRTERNYSSCTSRNSENLCSSSSGGGLLREKKKDRVKLRKPMFPRYLCIEWMKISTFFLKIMYLVSDCAKVVQ
jgi:hypothetical protein